MVKTESKRSNTKRSNMAWVHNSFVVREFWATKAALSVVMLAYNLMRVFVQAVIRQKAHQTLLTLHHKGLAMSAHWVTDKVGDQKKGESKAHVKLGSGP
jgi:hypothetical protein